MKKILGIILIGLFLMYGNAWGEGTCTDNFSNGTYPSQNNGNTFIVVFSWTGASNDGDVTPTACTGAINAYIKKVVTDPGDGVPPTDNYDITLTDSNGLDVMGGKLANRDTANTEVAYPYDTVSTSYPAEGTYVAGTITLNIDDASQAVNSATGTVTIYCDKRP